MTIEDPKVIPQGGPETYLTSLRLPNGMPPNKLTLQRVLAEANLPVPPIIPPSDYERVPDGDYHFRGYYDSSADMWTVDTLLTTRVHNVREIKHAANTINQSGSDPTLTNYLKINFRLSTPPPVGGFLQETVKRNMLYYSTWTYGGVLYITRGDLNRGSATSFCQFPNGQIWGGEDDEDSRFFINKLRKLHENTALVGDRVVSGCEPYDWKVDYLYDRNGNLTIIQARITSCRTTNETTQQAITSLNKLLEDGIAVRNMEVSQIRSIDSDPHILRLTNYRHLGSFDPRFLTRLDMRSIRGLILPRGLEGGLLLHNGYIFIAYALYWNLPIVFQ